MTPIFRTAFVVFVGVVCVVCWLRHCQNRVAPLIKRGEKSKPSAGLLFKGLFYFFFFVKILIIRVGYTRMYLVYKNAYKRPFWTFIQG